MRKKEKEMESPESVHSGGGTGSSSCIPSGSPNSSRRLEGADLIGIDGAAIKRMKSLMESLPAKA